MRKLLLILPLTFGITSASAAGHSIKLENSPPFSSCYFSEEKWHCDIDVSPPELSSSAKGSDPWENWELPKENEINRAHAYTFEFTEFDPEPGINWKSAEKICNAHLRAFFRDDLKIESVPELYDEGFKKPCEIVLQHEEEENRHEEADKVLEDKVKSLSDLNDLSKALGVFK